MELPPKYSFAWIGVGLSLLLFAFIWEGVLEYLFNVDFHRRSLEISLPWLLAAFGVIKLYQSTRPAARAAFNAIVGIGYLAALVFLMMLISGLELF